MKKPLGALSAIALVLAMTACGSDTEKPVAHAKTDNYTRAMALYKATSAATKESRDRKHRAAVKAAKEERQRLARARDEAGPVEQGDVQRHYDPLAACRASHGGSDEYCNDADPRVPGTRCPSGQHPVGATGACAP